MVNPFEQTLQAGIVNPREQAALSMRDAGIGSLGARSTLPRLTNREEAIARGHGGHPDQLWDQKINRIISEGHQKQDRWEELGGPNYNIVAPGKTLNMPQYPVLNKGKIGPGWLDAGIPATNQGYRVMNASDPTGNDGWIDRLGRWLFNDPYDKESDESLYQGTEQDKLESEYGTEGTGEFYPDKILRDLYPQALGEQAPYTTDQELYNFFEGLDSEDLGMEPQLDVRSRGIESLDEYQMAELTEDQMDLMRPGINQPDLPGGLTKEQLWNKVKENEYEGWGGILGFGSKPPQEDTTREEYDSYYQKLFEGEINPDTGKSYWIT